MLEALYAGLLFLGLFYLGRLFGRLIFVYIIERGTTRFCFSIVFALSTFIFIIVLLDASMSAGAVFSLNFSTHVLRLALVADLVSTMVVCPFFFLRSLLHDLRFHHCLALLAGCVLFSFVLGVWVPLFPWDGSALHLESRRGIGPRVWDAATGFIALFGVLAVGVLSGYAAVTTPLAFILPFCAKGSGDRARIALGVLAKRQRHLLSLWVSKQRQVIEVHRAAAPSYSDSGTGPRVWGWVRKSLLSTSRGRNGDDIAKLKAESDGIRAVSMAVFLEMNEMDSLVRSAESGATRCGWVQAVLGIVLLLHTVLKVVFTVISLLQWCSSPRPASVSIPVDTATRMISFLETYGLAVSHRDGAEQRVVWVSLILNAWMIISSIRGFLVTVFRLVLTYTNFLSVDTTVLAMTIGMGAYFVGQLLLLRLSPRLENQSVLSTVLQDLLPRNQLYYHLNDLVFVVASTFTVLIQHCVVMTPSELLHTVAE